MKYLDTQAIINVRKVMLLDRPVTQIKEMQEEINKALEDGWELAEIKIVPEDRHVYAQLTRLNITRYES